MDAVGYEFLRESLALHAFVPPCPALAKPVTRVEATPTFLAVPPSVLPTTTAPLDHILFALKHEGVNLQILSEAMHHVPSAALINELHRSPNGQYIRMAAYLWETLTGGVLAGAPPIGGAAVDLFDPGRYVTGPSTRNARWRVNFNGLGTPSYCATVERTPAIQDGIDAKLLEQVQAFLSSLGEGVLDRTIAWTYLHETRASFEIERETPSEGKAAAFISLLQQAHKKEPLSEDYLTALQSATVSNPIDRAPTFRHQQNWLGGPGRGTLAVTYVPPPPDLAQDLMQNLMTFANESAGHVDPIVAASVVSFGFVFIHPFMDGNGRLSRFLYHHALCRSGALDDGLVLPVSVAMKKHEAEYLRVLEAYSRPARERWSISWIDAGRYTFEFKAPDSIYRYWDATRQVEFGFKMAQQALDVELRQETQFLARYDAIRTAVEAQFDVRGSDLSVVIVSCIDNGGTVSKRRRDQFAQGIPAAVFDLIEVLAAQTASVEGAHSADEAPSPAATSTKSMGM